MERLLDSAISTAVMIVGFYVGIVLIFFWRKHTDRLIKFGDVRREYERHVSEITPPLLVGMVFNALLVIIINYWMDR